MSHLTEMRERTKVRCAYSHPSFDAYIDLIFFSCNVSTINPKRMAQAKKRAYRTIAQEVI